MNKKIKIKVKSKLICMSQKKKSLKTNKVIKMSNRNLKMILMKKNWVIMRIKMKNFRKTHKKFLINKFKKMMIKK
jgi:hypothetical protein